MATGDAKSSSTRWWLTHAGAVVLGAAVSAIIGHRSLPAADVAGKTFDRQPLIDAAWFAYGWGSEEDAAALLRRYAARLRAEPGDDPVSTRYELAFAEFRLAIIEHRPRPALLELCASVPKCRPEALDELVARLAAGRKVSVPP